MKDEELACMKEKANDQFELINRSLRKSKPARDNFDDLKWQLKAARLEIVNEQLRSEAKLRDWTIKDRDDKLTKL